MSWAASQCACAHAQFSPSPNGKVREVSEAKKRALAGNNIFNDAQVGICLPHIRSHAACDKSPHAHNFSAHAKLMATFGWDAACCLALGKYVFRKTRSELLS